MAIRFADVSIDVDAHEVRRSGDLVDVQPQVFAVLVHLIQQRDRVVPKEDLLDSIWQHRFVTESALTSRIKSARQAIGDNGRDQRMIRTVHGTGYRFIAALDEFDDSSASPERSDHPTPPAQVHLPAQSTPFVGRASEVQAVAELLGDTDCRLLTIVGPGGMGKTRLAVAVAEDIAVGYPDGVWFVSLAPVSDASAMVYAVADALGLLVDTGHDPAAQLLALVAARRMLVVLDNLEHLDDVSLVADLVAAAPGVRVLATSRERLHLQAEWIFELGGMGSPPPGVTASVDAGAVELFVGSARRLHAGFVLDGDDEAAVRRICRTLGGMPLAIELAAGWTRVLSLADIAAELESGFGLLETDLRDVPERHRSIRTVLDGSWERLAPDEREALGLLVNADDALRASLATAEAIGDRRGVALACRNVSILAGWFGRYDEARSLIDRAVSLSREFDDRLGSAYALRELGKVLMFNEQVERCSQVVIFDVRETRCAEAVAAMLDVNTGPWSTANGRLAVRPGGLPIE